MTPAEIKVLLHYHTSANDYEGEMSHKFVDEICERFVDEGFLNKNYGENPVYKITAKGNFYVVHGLCDVPLPVLEYRIPCNDTGQWDIGDHGPFKCDPCPAPEPEYTKEGYLIAPERWMCGGGGAENTRGAVEAFGWLEKFMTGDTATLKNHKRDQGAWCRNMAIVRQALAAPDHTPNYETLEAMLEANQFTISVLESRLRDHTELLREALENAMIAKKIANDESVKLSKVKTHEYYQINKIWLFLHNIEAKLTAALKPREE